MAEENESSSVKKHRVIHWNPEAGREQTSRRWTWKRMLAWGVGGFFALIIALGLINRIPKLFGGTTLSDMITGRADAQRTDVAAQPVDPNAEFVTRAKAEQSHDLVSKGLAKLRGMPTDHQRQIDSLILMEKDLAMGQQLLKSHEFAQAQTTFSRLQKDIETFSQNVKAKDEAKRGYDAILLRIRDLEPARPFSGESLELAMTAAAEGRRLVESGNFIEATRAFQRGTNELKKAEQALADFVRDSIIKGERALAKGQKDESKAGFTAALEKAPGNEAAQRGLKRAENIDRVYALLLQGEKLEKESKFAEAADSYGKAFALDSFSAEAQQGQARAGRLEKETKFATAKTAADEAVKKREWSVAIQEYQNALKVYPTKTEVQAALKSAKENAHKDAVAKALAKGYAYEAEHRWAEAREAYNETLALDPDNADAKERYKETGKIVRALLAYNDKIESAERLANKAEFQTALKHFNEAMTYKPSYLEYSDRVLQLRNLLQQQSKPVEVTFKSDGKTWVSIGAFKTPAQFETNTFKIMPGDYEVIGRRKGYRDLKMLLQVRNGSPAPVVNVVCSVSADKL